ncbi:MULTISPECIES: phage tail assembly chaperone [Peribacillus]|uniref:phage tail assembly chaperone n=1 Tax=Peribacillus TaxID=2675229 RepID=UPI001F4E80F7|nr:MULTISPECIES: hypothetical protein [unclassified Peribacillus]MCK1985166.1 hypothetical protein [Peribacillus sp. Aquil_B1]MCK2007184.1 hypothetical protein [Peribacillus sp. Aquil_B8]
MDMLSKFLQTDLNIEKPVYLKRIDGELIVKAIDSKTLTRLQAQATHGKEMDEQLFGAVLVSHACTNMDFGDTKMLEKFEASDAADCVQKCLLAGEVLKLVNAIMEVSGFNDMTTQVEESKN